MRVATLVTAVSLEVIPATLAHLHLHPRQPLKAAPAGTMPNLALMLKGVGNPAAGHRETFKPDARGDRHTRLFLKLPFHVRDNNTHIHFLIDIGSEVSVIPPSLLDCQLSPDKLTLTAVNNTPFQTFGK